MLMLVSDKVAHWASNIYSRNGSDETPIRPVDNLQLREFGKAFFGEFDADARLLRHCRPAFVLRRRTSGRGHA